MLKLAGPCLLIIVIALTIWAIRDEPRAKRKKVEETFADRENLTPEAFYDRHFRAEGIAPEIVIGMRKILEEQLDADLSCLAAEDDFSKNLSFFWDFDSMADVEIIMALEEHFNIKITDQEAQNAHTVADLVHLIDAKLKPDPEENSA